MKYKSKILENNTKLDYFVNPTLQELDDIESGYIRYVADNANKKVFVWDAYFKIHSEAMYDLGMKYTDIWVTDKYMYFIGWANKTGSWFITNNNDVLSYIIEKDDLVYDDVVDKILAVDWSWVENYSIKVIDYVQSLKNIWKEKKDRLYKRMKQSKFFDMDKKTSYFVNPDSAELDSLHADYIRFIADFETKQVYCWDGNAIVHESAARGILNLSGYPDKNRYYEGFAKKKGGKYVMRDYNNTLEYMLQDYLKYRDEYIYDSILKYIVEKDWSWLEYYFDLTVVIKNILNYVPVKVYASKKIVSKIINLVEEIIKR